MSSRLVHKLVTVSLIALAACGDKAGPDLQLESLVTFDVAVVSADAVIADVAEQGHVFPLPDGIGIVTNYDALGNVQEAFDEVTTASIRIVREGIYEGGHAGWSGAVTRTRETTVTGLEGDETTRTVNGTGSSTVSRSSHSDENGDRSYNMTGTTVISDVVHAVPKEGNPYPLSGTITRDMTAVIVNGPNDDETHTRHVVITFNGTQLATLNVFYGVQFATMAANGELFEVDLSIRDGRRPLRRYGR
jgi:hypothetical protein